MRVRFGECVLDCDTWQLSFRGEAVHLSLKAFQFLELFPESSSRALLKGEIYELLRSGRFVSDGSLAKPSPQPVDLVARRFRRQQREAPDMAGLVECRSLEDPVRRSRIPSRWGRARIGAPQRQAV